jgi:hypothetical protein
MNDGNLFVPKYNKAGRAVILKVFRWPRNEDGLDNAESGHHLFH